MGSKKSDQELLHQRPLPFSKHQNNIGDNTVLTSSYFLELLNKPAIQHKLPSDFDTQEEAKHLADLCEKMIGNGVSGMGSGLFC